MRRHYPFSQRNEATERVVGWKLEAMGGVGNMGGG